MTVTMLYFDTISKIIKKHRFSWRDVENIQDNDSRVRHTFSVIDGCKKSYTESLRRAFYWSHIGRAFDENGEYEKVLIAAFLEALKEAEEYQMNQPLDGQEELTLLEG